MTLTALQISPPPHQQTYTIYHYLTLSLAKNTYTLTVFTSESTDLPCTGMYGISHLIRCYIYIEHEALQHAILKMGCEHVCT